MNLEERLRARIRREGPISFCEWMKAALYDERQGYYCTDRVRQGRAGDYRTAPETSPLFAATFASYFAKLFAELGSPDRFTIVEAGAGSGEFAFGVLTTLRSEHPNVFGGTNYVIAEISDSSRERCAARLSEFSDRVSFRSPTLKEDQLGTVALPHGRASDTITGIIFSNELLDALPVDRVVMRQGRLRQLCVGLDQDVFAWVESDLEKSVAEYCDRAGLDLQEGQIAEINLNAEAFLERAGNLLEHGYVITVDYGAERKDLLSDPGRYGGTLRAFRRHRFDDNVLANPGQKDLTTTIDWTHIIESGERAALKTVRFERLDQFLLAEGLLDRLAAVTDSGMAASEALRHTTSARQLILPGGMGVSFQVLVQRKDPSTLRV